MCQGASTQLPCMLDCVPAPDSEPSVGTLCPLECPFISWCALGTADEGRALPGAGCTGGGHRRSFPPSADCHLGFAYTMAVTCAAIHAVRCRTAMVWELVTRLHCQQICKQRRVCASWAGQARLIEFAPHK